MESTRDGLRVEQRRVAGGGVARVADGHVAGQLGEHVVGEDLRNQAHALDVGQMLAVGRGDAGRFLPAMLQRVEAEVGLARGVGMAVDGDDAAFFVQLVADRRAVDRGSRIVTVEPWTSTAADPLQGFGYVRDAVDSLITATGSCQDLVVKIGFQGGGPDACAARRAERR